MWEVGRMMCLGALAGLSVTDIFWRKIPAEFFVMGTAGVLIYQAVCRETGWAATYVPDVNSKEDMCALASAISLVENGRKAVAADVERGWALL